MKTSFKTNFLNAFRAVFKIPFMEKILVRKTIGRSFEEKIVKFIPNNYQYSRNAWRTAKRDGINYRLNLYDYIDWWLYFGIKDPGRDKLYALVKKDSVIFDVGTNVGETLLNFAKLTSPEGHVHGFEPDSINFKRCMDNVKLNNFTNILINQKGLGNVAGKFSLMVDTPSNRGGNRIAQNVHEKSTETIEVITLDRYAEEIKIHKLDLIKIDVEGFEMNVLKGAISTLTSLKPILFIELDNTNLIEQKSSAKELIAFLEQLNYSIHNAQTNEKITSLSDFTNCHFDIVCNNQN